MTIAIITVLAAVLLVQSFRLRLRTNDWKFLNDWVCTRVTADKSSEVARPWNVKLDARWLTQNPDAVDALRAGELDVSTLPLAAFEAVTGPRPKDAS